MRFLRRQLLIWILAFTAMLFLGSLTSIFMLRASAPAESTPPLFFARLVEKMGNGDRSAGLREVETLSKGGRPVNFQILDLNGEPVYPLDSSAPLNFHKLKLPEKAHEYLALDESHDLIPQRPRKWLIRLNGEPTEYLYMNFSQGQVSPAAKSISLAVFLLVLSIFAGAGFTLVLLFQSLRQMQNTERSRISLLQELAHDLRTPVASLKNLLETMQAQDSTLPIHLRQELLMLSLKEAEYFQRLVEDLLILAQVSDPRYNLNRVHLDLSELVADEAESKAFKGQHDPKEGGLIKLILNTPDEPVEISGDSHLLRRMIRNALDNAFSFARSQVTVTLKVNGSQGVSLYIEDDGPGLSPEALASFGQRRLTRALGRQEDGRLSVGLGSVIMKALAQLHSGTVQAMNHSETVGGTGARVVIRLGQVRRSDSRSPASS